MEHRGAGNQDLLRDFLADADVPCPGCRYNLRGLGGWACPECGESLCLRVGFVEPRMGLYLCGLIGLSAGLGFHGVLLVFAGWAVLVERGGPSAGDFVPIFTGLGLGGAALATWLRSRTRIRRATDLQARLLVAGCWALSAMTTLLFMIVVGN